jgi:natural product precursor
MKKSFNTKLSLKKTDIASLSEKEMKGVQGGYTESAGCPPPPPAPSGGCGPVTAGGSICDAYKPSNVHCNVATYTC